MTPPLLFPALLDALIVVVAVGLSVWLRPWRMLSGEPVPTAWMLAWAALPLSWGLDRWLSMPLGVPMSGATLLVLFMGWPLAMLAMPIAALALALGHVDGLVALHRLAWLGVVPGTFALGLGAAVRHGLPRHPLVYILGRGYFGTFVAVFGAGLTATWLLGDPSGASDLPPTGAGTLRGAGREVPLAALALAAFGEAFLTGMLAAIGVAFRPGWLATWSDRLYLPPPR